MNIEKSYLDTMHRIIQREYFGPVEGPLEHFLQTIEFVAMRVSCTLQKEIQGMYEMIDRDPRALHRGLDRYNLRAFCEFQQLDYLVSELIQQVDELRIQAVSRTQEVFYLLKLLVDATMAIYWKDWRRYGNN